jgi:hypothetical protein
VELVRLTNEVSVLVMGGDGAALFGDLPQLRAAIVTAAPSKPPSPSCATTPPAKSKATPPAAKPVVAASKTKPCAVCGAAFKPKTSERTCSPTCQAKRRAEQAAGAKAKYVAKVKVAKKQTAAYVDKFSAKKPAAALPPEPQAPTAPEKKAPTAPEKKVDSASRLRMLKNAAYRVSLEQREEEPEA